MATTTARRPSGLFGIDTPSLADIPAAPDGSVLVALPQTIARHVVNSHAHPGVVSAVRSAHATRRGVGRTFHVALTRDQAGALARMLASDRTAMERGELSTTGLGFRRPNLTACINRITAALGA